MTLTKKPFEYIMGKNEKMLVTTTFPTLSKTEILILAKFDLSSANALKLDQLKKLSFGKELIHMQLELSLNVT